MVLGNIGMVGLLIAGVTVSQASTVELNLSNLEANGWKATTTYVWGGSTNATVTESSDQGADSFRFFSGLMPVSWEFQWAGISTAALAGVPLANISSVKIRTLGASGDGPHWQPPTFTWVVDKGDTNQRCLTWKPWSGSNAREPGVWHEYDAATTGRWYLEETETYYDSLAALKAALPHAYFEYSAELPLSWGYASQNSFNVGFCPLYDADRAFFNGTTGSVDWFEIGVNGATTAYNLTPEPASVLLLVLGGLLQRRRG